MKLNNINAYPKLDVYMNQNEVFWTMKNILYLLAVNLIIDYYIFTSLI